MSSGIVSFINEFSFSLNMSRLLELIETERQAIKVRTGIETNRIQLNVTDNSKSFSVEATYSYTTGDLFKFSIEFEDNEPDNSFTQDEIDSITDVIGKPTSLNIKAGKYDPRFDVESNLSLDEQRFLFRLDIRKWFIFNYCKWTCEVETSTSYNDILLRKKDGIYQVIDYNELGDLVKASAKNEPMGSRLKLQTRIDTSRLHDVYEWITSIDHNPLIAIDGKNIYATIGDYGVEPSRDLVLNHFSFEYCARLNGSDTIVPFDDILKMENAVLSYRNFDIGHANIKVLS